MRGWELTANPPKEAFLGVARERAADVDRKHRQRTDADGRIVVGRTLELGMIMSFSGKVLLFGWEVRSEKEGWW